MRRSRLRGRRATPCLICGHPGADAQRGVVDAVAERVRVGDAEEDIAADYEITVEAVRLAVEFEEKPVDP